MIHCLGSESSPAIPVNHLQTTSGKRWPRRVDIGSFANSNGRNDRMCPDRSSKSIFVNLLSMRSVSQSWRRLDGARGDFTNNSVKSFLYVGSSVPIDNYARQLWRHAAPPATLAMNFSCSPVDRVPHFRPLPVARFATRLVRSGTARSFAFANFGNARVSVRFADHPPHSPSTPFRATWVIARRGAQRRVTTGSPLV